jgi:hypothetical protein
MSTKFKISCVLLALASLSFSLDALADNFPLCSTNQVADYTVSNGAMAMKMCYAAPSSLKVKINSISLLKQDGTPVGFYTPSTPQYVDLMTGLTDLAQNVTPVSGVYKALRISIDANWKITAGSDYTPSGASTQYCRTQQNSGTFQSTNWSGDVHTQKLSDANVSPVETTYLHNAFSFVSSTAVGTEQQNDSAYFSKTTFTVNAGGVSTIEHYLVNAGGTLERNAGSITGEVIDVNLLAPVVINQETDAIYTLNFDLSKAIGFAHEYTTNFGATVNYRNSGCAYMTIGPLPVTLTVE